MERNPLSHQFNFCICAATSGVDNLRSGDWMWPWGPRTFPGGSGSVAVVAMRSDGCHCSHIYPTVPPAMEPAGPVGTIPCLHQPRCNAAVAVGEGSAVRASSSHQSRCQWSGPWLKKFANPCATHYLIASMLWAANAFVLLAFLLPVSLCIFIASGCFN